MNGLHVDVPLHVLWPSSRRKAATGRGGHALPVAGLLACLLAVLSGLTASRVLAQGPGGPPVERILQFMDRNRNNQLDPEELQRMPPPLRDAFARFGLNGSRPVGLQELQQVLPRVWEEMRREREERERRFRDGDGGRAFDRDERRYYRDDRRFEDRRSGDRGDPRSARQPQRPRFEPRKREPITAILPAEWQPLDRNGDNQIALYEMPRERWSAFRQVDLNNDGFATPAEILYLQAKQKSAEANGGTRSDAAPSSAARTTPASFGGPSRPVAAGATAALPGSSVPPGGRFARPGAGAGPGARAGRFGGGAFGRRDRGGPQSGSGPSEQYARYVFQVLDRNRDGSIDAEEWQRSQRTRQAFERGGVNVSFPMNFDTFWQQYQKVGSGR